MKFSEIDFKNCKNTWYRTPLEIKKLFKEKSPNVFSQISLGIIHLNQHYICSWWVTSKSYILLGVFKRDSQYGCSEILKEKRIYNFKEFCEILNQSIDHYYRIEQLNCFS